MSADYRIMERALGEKIATLRRQRQMSQANLANAAYLGEATISRIESGKTSPKLYNLHGIAQALNISLSELFSGIDG